MDQQRCVAAVVEDHVRRADRAVRHPPFEDAVRVLPVFVERLALVREHRRAARGDRGGGMVLRRIDVARRPAHVGAERLQRLDQHGGLDRHVQRAGDARAAQRLLGARIPRGSPSGRASRSRRWRFPCAPSRRAPGRRRGSRRSSWYRCLRSCVTPCRATWRHAGRRHESHSSSRGQRSRGSTSAVAMDGEPRAWQRDGPVKVRGDCCNAPRGAAGILPQN